MKILMMTNTYLPLVGGLERSIQSFSGQLRARGHEIKIAAPEFPDQPAREKDVIRVAAIEKFVGTPFSVTLPLPGILQDLVSEFKPDIIHSHHPFLMGDLALRLCGQNKIPLVFTYHTMFEYYQDAFAMDQEMIQKFVVELATGYANMADQVIVPSESVGRVLKERKVTTPISVVPTGINVKRFLGTAGDFRKKHGIPAKAFVIGHTGRLAPEKNLTFLSEAVSEFLKNHKNARFLIVGNGPSEREMRKIFSAWGIQRQVHFAGIQKGKSLVNAYHAMDLFAFASKSETQGIVLAEAMGAGLPVVALDASGVREVVKDKQNGRLLMGDSRSDYAAVLSWCASRSVSQWNRIKKTAIETAREFSEENAADRMLHVYQGVKWREGRFGQEQAGQWEAAVGRFKTEWGMILNLGRAAGSAIVKSAVLENSFAKKVEQLTQKQMKDARRVWTLLLKKRRQQTQNVSDAVKTKIETDAEKLAHNIHLQERELTELSRKAVGACEAFEKRLNESYMQIENGPEHSDKKNKETVIEKKAGVNREAP